MSRSALRTTFPCVLLLAACGGGSGDPQTELASAKAAAQKGDDEAAIEAFQEVAADASATDEQRLEALTELVVCNARARTEADATQAFKDLQARCGDRLTWENLATLGDQVASQGCTDTALAIITVATEKAKGDAQAKDRLQKLADVIANADPDAAAALQALGYTN